MSGKLIWLSVMLIVAGAISVALVTSSSALAVNAKAYVQSFD